MNDFNPNPIEYNTGEIQNMYVVLKNKNKFEVIGYDIPLGRIDAENGQTYLEDEIDHLEISLNELQEVARYQGKW